MNKKVDNGASSIGSKVKGFAENVGYGALDKLDSAGQFLKNPAVLATLIGGTGAGLAGGFLESRRKGDDDETEEERRKRILRNALLFGGGTAGAIGLGSLAYNNLNTAVQGGPVDNTLEKANLLGRGVPLGLTAWGLHTKGKRHEMDSKTVLMNKLRGILSKHNTDTSDDSMASLEFLMNANKNGNKPLAFAKKDEVFNKLITNLQGSVAGDPPGVMEATNFLNTSEGNRMKADAGFIDSSSTGWAETGAKAKRVGKRIIGNNRTSNILRALGLTASVAAPEVTNFALDTLGKKVV